LYHAPHYAERDHTKNEFQGTSDKGTDQYSNPSVRTRYLVEMHTNNKEEAREICGGTSMPIEN
jgi:hypothetical protein